MPRFALFLIRIRLRITLILLGVLLFILIIIRIFRGLIFFRASMGKFFRAIRSSIA